MKPHVEMRRRITGAADVLLTALDESVLDGDGLVDNGALRRATVPIDRLLCAKSGPPSGVYITWDVRGICRYVGSARRPASRAAVRDRLAEHMRLEGRRARWYAVTVLPIRPTLGIEILRECEGIVARRLRPLEGAAHPIPSVERPLRDLLAAGSVSVR